jgi:hypothetical protein
MSVTEVPEATAAGCLPATAVAPQHSGCRINDNAVAACLLGAERLFENAPKVEFEDVVVGVEGIKGAMTVVVSLEPSMA